MSYARNLSQAIVSLPWLGSAIQSASTKWSNKAERSGKAQLPGSGATSSYRVSAYGRLTLCSDGIMLSIAEAGSRFTYAYSLYLVILVGFHVPAQFSMIYQI